MFNSWWCQRTFEISRGTKLPFRHQHHHHRLLQPGLGCYGLGRPHWRQQVTLSWLHWINLVVAQHHWCCLHPPPLFTIQSVKRILQEETSRKDTPRAKNNNNNIIRVAWHAILSTLVSGGVSQPASLFLMNCIINWPAHNLLLIVLAPAWHPVMHIPCWMMVQQR